MRLCFQTRCKRPHLCFRGHAIHRDLWGLLCDQTGSRKIQDDGPTTQHACISASRQDINEIPTATPICFALKGSEWTSEVSWTFECEWLRGETLVSFKFSIMGAIEKINNVSYREHFVHIFILVNILPYSFCFVGEISLQLSAVTVWRIH
jgi:hypothetical protein